jgi:ectoine hydroxylase-related dioxygenase (phytanoyl-CoA dioxygenase family)
MSQHPSRLHGSEILNALDRDGFAIVPELADDDTLAALSRAIEDAGAGKSARRRAGGGSYAVRNLLDVREVLDWATREEVVALVRAAGGDGTARPVRGLMFDKTPQANWKVAWHQDRSIAVAGRGSADVPGFGPWSTKSGVTHVQPPANVLECMVTVRLHVDDCGADNGPLRVVPGSHRAGILAPADVERLPRERGEIACAVPRGGALLMRPLLLHASSAATTPRRRRVIHIEYSSDALPHPLRWHADGQAHPVASRSPS